MAASSVKLKSLMSKMEITKDELIRKATGQGQASLVFPDEEKTYFRQYSFDSGNTTGGREDAIRWISNRL